jgi:cyclic nucleotide-binding protein
VDAGQSGGGRINVTKVGYGPASITFAPVVLPDLRPDPEIGPSWARFVQTAGGQTGFPTPRRVRHEPYLQIGGPVTWSTLALTIHSDGTVEPRLVGASSFPRHWVYDHTGRLVAKSGFIDHDTWWREAFGTHTPWGAEDSAPIVTAVESALERQLSVVVINAKPQSRRLQAGRTLVQQGEQGEELFLLFDGVLRVEVDGRPVTEVGPGAIVGEMALLQEGRRTATLRAVTPCRVAVVPKDRIDRQALEEVAKSRMPRPERWRVAEALPKPPASSYRFPLELHAELPSCCLDSSSPALHQTHSRPQLLPSPATFTPTRHNTYHRGNQMG